MNQHTILLAQIAVAGHAAAVTRNRLDSLLLTAQELELQIDEASYQLEQIERERNTLRKRKSRLLTGKN